MCSLTPNCYNDDVRHRKGCYKCRSRAQRQKYMLQHTYWHLKSNAKRRGIFFDLTLGQWKAFCNRTGYLKLRGIEAHSMSVDRKNPTKGYTAKNIRPLTLSDNTKKQRGPDALKIAKATFKSKEDSETPF